MKSWYLIHTKPRQEQIAKENLLRQGYEIYLPLAPVRRRRKKKITQVIEPMFPRYLFIQLSDQTDDWRPIRSTLGVSVLVKFGEVPAKIPVTLIQELRSREDESGVQVLEQKTLSKGDHVRIAEGPLEGYAGIYQCKTGKDRVMLLLEIAQQTINFTLPANKIESD